MSKRFATTYPNLAKALEKDKVMSMVTDEGEGVYIAYDTSGKELEIGRVGYESTLESYLIDNPYLLN